MVASKIKTIKKQIIDIGRRLYDKNLITALDGNISVRLSENRFLITSSGVCKGSLRLSDILVIDGNGKVIQGTKKPSIETAMHIHIYAERTDIKAIIHAHPCYSTVVGMTEKKFRPQSVNCTLLGNVSIAPFAEPGTKKVIKSIKPYVKKSSVILLSHHGAVTYSTDLENAFFKMENLEFCAKTHLLCKRQGKLNRS